MIFTDILLLIATQVLLDSTRERRIHFLSLQALGEMLFLCCQWLKRHYCAFSRFHHLCCCIFPLSIHLPASLRCTKSCASAHSVGWPPEACRDIHPCTHYLWREWGDLCCPSPASKPELSSDRADVKRLSQGNPALCGGVREGSGCYQHSVGKCPSFLQADSFSLWSIRGSYLPVKESRLKFIT